MIFHPKQRDISHVTLEPTLNGDKVERIDILFSRGGYRQAHIMEISYRNVISQDLNVFWVAIPTKELFAVVLSQNNVL